MNVRELSDAGQKQCLRELAHSLFLASVALEARCGVTDPENQEVYESCLRGDIQCVLDLADAIRAHKNSSFPAAPVENSDGVPGHSTVGEDPTETTTTSSYKGGPAA